MAKDLNAAAIRALPWVQSVVKTPPRPWNNPGDDTGYTITTKADSLKVRVTHGVIVAGDTAWIDEKNKLKDPFLVALPQLKIRVRTGDYPYVRLVRAPKLKGRNFLSYPAYDGYRQDRSSWDNYTRACLGDWARDIVYAKSYPLMAEIVAAFLQTAIPHRTENRESASFAYHLGKMPEEYVKQEAPYEIAFARNTLYDTEFF